MIKKVEQLDNYLVRSQILKYFKISKKTYTRWIKKKLLKPIRKGNSYLYKKQDIIKLVDSFPEY